MSLLTNTISPAEAQFWHEQAEKAPQLLRAKIQEANKELTPDLPLKKVVGIGLGAVLGAASFTERVPGYWKLLTGSGAIVAGFIGWEAWARQNRAQSVRADSVDYANRLERDPALTNMLANYLGTCVTADDIQERGLNAAIALHTDVFAIRSHLYFKHGATPQLPGL